MYVSNMSSSPVVPKCYLWFSSINILIHCTLCVTVRLRWQCLLPHLYVISCHQLQWYRIRSVAKEISLMSMSWELRATKVLGQAQIIFRHELSWASHTDIWFVWVDVDNIGITLIAQIEIMIIISSLHTSDWSNGKQSKFQPVSSRKINLAPAHCANSTEIYKKYHSYHETNLIMGTKIWFVAL